MRSRDMLSELREIATSLQEVADRFNQFAETLEKEYDQSRHQHPVIVDTLKILKSESS